MKHLGPQHRAAVLALLPDDGPGLDRHQLAARIGISSMSVSRALKRLVEEGKAHVSGYTPNETNGKPRELFSAGPTPPDLCLVRPRLLNPTEAAERRRAMPTQINRMSYLSNALFGR